MAIKGIKLPKQKAKKDPKFGDEVHIGHEPVWDTDRAAKFSDKDFDNHLRTSLNYYNYFYNARDLKPIVAQWVAKNTKLTPKQLAAYAISSHDLTPSTVGAIIKAFNKGMPQRPRQVEYIKAKVLAAINDKDTQAAVKAATPATDKKGKPGPYIPTIQDRLNEKTREAIGEIEFQVDNVFTNKPVTMKVYEFLTTKNIAQAQVGKIRTVFQKQVDELAALKAGKDEQLKEGYSHVAKATIKRLNEFYVTLFADLDSYTAVKKATKKARVKKPQSKDKLVAKMKFLKESKELKLVSIPPTAVVGATTLWVFDTKTRKLGCYVADSTAGTLGVKGTTLLGFDTTNSTAKTLRKPEAQLKELMNSGKIALRTFMKGIKSVEVKLTGRLNANQILLKVQ